jgi:hypothetical protein
MSYRTRLVEEGKPIPQNSDHDLEEEEEISISRPSQWSGMSTDISSINNKSMDSMDIDGPHRVQAHTPHTSVNASSLQARLKGAPVKGEKVANAKQASKKKSTRTGKYKITSQFEIGAPMATEQIVQNDPQPPYHQLYHQQQHPFAVEEHYQHPYTVGHQNPLKVANANKILHKQEDYKITSQFEIGAPMATEQIVQNDPQPQYYQHRNQQSHTVEEHEPLERMEIDEVQLQRLPMIVIDGANLAHAYVHATEGHGRDNTNHDTNTFRRKRIEPNALGIQIAVAYFRNAGCRVQVVIPSYWMNRKPNRSNGNMNGSGTAASDQMQILKTMQEEKILCCSPPTDDDDAYCIAIAKRIDARSRLMHSATNLTELTDVGGAFILSNDLFRDAMERDASGELRAWLKSGDAPSPGDHQFPRRISYSFCDLGSMNRYGDEQLDFVPNPRHPLVAMTDRLNRANGGYVNDI